MNCVMCWVCLTCIVGCADAPGTEQTQATSVTATDTGIATDDGIASGDMSASASGSGDDGLDDGETGVTFDVGGGDGATDPPGRVCTVVDGTDAIGTCDQTAPADAFEPDVQWTWTDANDENDSIVTPLVGNFTDDNRDGEIDLCDVPDVIVFAAHPDRATGDIGQAGDLYLLDGETGTEHFQFEHAVQPTITPTLGDLGGDGFPEVVAAPTDAERIAFEHTGEVKWIAPTEWNDGWCASIALADLDHDGTPEIIAGRIVTDANGATLRTTTEPAGGCAAPPCRKP